MAADPQMQEHARTYAQIVATAWSDDAFKQRLLASPAAVLQEHGIDVPEGTEVRVVEGQTQPEFGDGAIVLPMPPKPSAEELSDEELDLAAGGWCTSGGCEDTPPVRDETGKLKYTPYYKTTTT